jgi:hypothetical protein
MPSLAQKEARKRRLARERAQRWRDRQPKTARDDGQEPFDLEAYTPLIEQPARTCKQCQLAATFSNGNGWYCHEHGKAAAVPASAADPKAVLVEELPVQPRPDPFAFNTANDPYRPAWVKAMDPKGAEIRLTANPRAAYRFGGELQKHEAAEAAQEATAKATAEARARDTRGWTAGQYEEEL